MGSACGRHPEVELGLELKDVVPDDQYLYPYAKHSVKYYGSHAIYLVTEGVDFSSTMEEQRRGCTTVLFDSFLFLLPDKAWKQLNSFAP
jgi:hypothetical protein